MPDVRNTRVVDIARELASFGIRVQIHDPIADAETVETEITRVTARYAKQAKVPGFRQGKVPTTVARQRFKDQILYDVAQAMIPRLVTDALKAREFGAEGVPVLLCGVIDHAAHGEPADRRGVVNLGAIELPSDLRAPLEVVRASTDLHI